jgi:hypothetical protein
MSATHLHAPLGGLSRVSPRPRRTGGLVGRALRAIRNWRRRRHNRHQIVSLNARISRDLESRRNDPLDLDREQREHDAWVNALGFPPF